MDRIFSMRAFSRVAETGNFSVVAEHMECSTGSISRAVGSLEEHLHTRLLQRTTRHVSLTECGERYYQRCKKILADLDDAEAEASNAHTLPRGRLRVHAVPDIGLTQLTSTIVEYRQAFPAVSVDLKLLPRMANLVENEFDVSIVSASALPDSRNVSKLVGRCERTLVAAPEYLARHPVETLDDLPNHTLMHTSSSFDPTSGWLAEIAGHATGGAKPAGQFVVDNMQALRVALLAGAGVGAVPTYSVVDDVKEGKLIQLFPGYPLQAINVFVMYPSRRFVDAKIRTFVEFLTVSLKKKLDLRIETTEAIASSGCAQAVLQA